MSDDLQIVIDDDDEPAHTSRTPRSVDEIDQESARHRAETARLNRHTAQLRTETARNNVATALNIADTEAATARTSYKSALDAYDTDGIVEAQARLTAIEARRVRLQEQEQALQRAPLPPADPVDAYCANRSEPTAQWLRAHPEYVVDGRKNAKLTSAHYEAVADGLEPDTSSYFSFVERKLGIDRGGSGGSSGRRAAAPDFNPADARTHISDDGKTVRLTAGEARAATDGTLIFNFGPNRGKPIGVAEAARRKAAMVAEGRYSQIG